MTRYRMYSVRCQCIQMGHSFVLDLERKEDVSTTTLTDTGKGFGFAVFRERTPITCPYCNSLCHLLPGAAQLEVDFKPGK